MTYRLKSHLHLTFIGERAVLLDEQADRYRLVPEGIAGSLRTMAEGGTAPDPAIDRLTELAIIEPGDGGIRPATSTSVITSAIEISTLPASGPSTGAVGLSFLSAIIRLRLTGFAAALARARRHAVTAAELRHVDTAVGMAQRFVRRRRALPFERACLPDSLALHALLCRASVPTRLVIGVRLEPFAAHCWLQAGSIVLNDSCDSVTRYQPILEL